MKRHCLFPIPFFFPVAFPFPAVSVQDDFPSLMFFFYRAAWARLSSKHMFAPPQHLNWAWLVQIGTVWSAVWRSAVHVGSELAPDGIISWTLSLISEETMKRIFYALLTLFPFFATCSWGHHFPRMMNHNLLSCPIPLFFLVVSSEPFTWWNNGTRLNCAQDLENHAFIQQPDIVFFCSLFCS